MQQQQLPTQFGDFQEPPLPHDQQPLLHTDSTVATAAAAAAGGHGGDVPLDQLQQPLDEVSGTDSVVCVNDPDPGRVVREDAAGTKPQRYIQSAAVSSALVSSTVSSSRDVHASSSVSRDDTPKEAERGTTSSQGGPSHRKAEIAKNTVPASPAAISLSQTQLPNAVRSDMDIETAAVPTPDEVRFQRSQEHVY